MMTNDESNTIAEKLVSLTRSLSVNRLRAYARDENIEAFQRPLAPVYSNWMALILVVSRAVRVTFKVHYKLESVKPLAALLYDKPEGMSIHQTTDFMKEYCNLTAGMVKKALELADVSVGISLPIHCHGFDETFYPKPNENHGRESAWDLVSAGGSKIWMMTCSTVIELNEPESLTKILTVDPESAAFGSGGDVEFL